MTSSAILHWLDRMTALAASDLYLTVDAPPTVRGPDGMIALDPTPLTPAALAAILADLAGPEGPTDTEAAQERNFALIRGENRFRVNVFRQRQQSGSVIRRISGRIPTLADLRLPPLLGTLALEARGLILVVGATGSGKSTTLAAMIDHRNSRQTGHILTVEDPIEYDHRHKKSLVTQREIGLDTVSYPVALKNALRQRPDCVLIGEIRDDIVMEQALMFAETGHLCLATLHATNANQALDRILNWFPDSRHRQLRLNLSLNLRSIVSQRLLPRRAGGRVAALEILLNQGSIRELILKGETSQLKDIMARGGDQGMVTFDQSLLTLALAGEIDDESALAEADRPTDLALSLRQSRLTGAGLAGVDTGGLSFQ